MSMLSLSSLGLSLSSWVQSSLPTTLPRCSSKSSLSPWESSRFGPVRWPSASCRLFFSPPPAQLPKPERVLQPAREPGWSPERDKEQIAYFQCKTICAPAGTERTTCVTCALCPSRPARSPAAAPNSAWEVPIPSITLRRYGLAAERSKSQNSATNSDGHHPIYRRRKRAAPRRCPG